MAFLHLGIALLFYLLLFILLGLADLFISAKIGCFNSYEKSLPSTVSTKVGFALFGAVNLYDFLTRTIKSFFAYAGGYGPSVDAAFNTCVFILCSLIAVIISVLFFFNILPNFTQSNATMFIIVKLFTSLLMHGFATGMFNALPIILIFVSVKIVLSITEEKSNAYLSTMKFILWVSPIFNLLALAPINRQTILMNLLIIAETVGLFFIVYSICGKLEIKADFKKGLVPFCVIMVCMGIFIGLALLPRSSTHGCGHPACQEYGPFPCYGKNNTCPNTTNCCYDPYCNECD